MDMVASTTDMAFTFTPNTTKTAEKLISPYFVHNDLTISLDTSAAANNLVLKFRKAKLNIGVW